MVRLNLLSGVAALVLLAAPAVAQEVGGIQLTPQVLNTPDAQQQAMNLAFSLLQRAQLAQQMLLSHGNLALGSGVPVQAPTSPNAVNPAAGRSAIDQQAIARLRGDAGLLAGFSGGQPLAASRQKIAAAPSYVDQSHTVVVNAVESPVSIGNGNVVRQQVSNSTAIDRGGAAVASANLHQKGGRKSGATVSQDAASSAVSYGGVAQSTASNSSTVQR